MRRFLGILAGILAGIVLQGAVVYLASLFIAMPSVNSVAREEVAQAFASASVPALIVTVISYFLAGTAAAWIGIAVGRQVWVGLLCVAVIALISLAIAFLYPEPGWAQFGAFIAALAGGLVGKHGGAAGVSREGAVLPVDA